MTCATAASASSWTPTPARCWAWPAQPDYDLNNYSAVLDQVLQQTLAELDPTARRTARRWGSARLKQWSNKALNTSYEPGSTFKSIVLAAALEEGVTSMNDTFTCTGQITVDKWSIRCSDRRGARRPESGQGGGEIPCNPAFVTSVSGWARINSMIIWRSSASRR